ncbi:MAG: hypothetical protein HY717_10650 [Planctomycetes bacterium]|nr:hypothetical protein [Planctomycetota bacterium]
MLFCLAGWAAAWLLAHGMPGCAGGPGGRGSMPAGALGIAGGAQEEVQPLAVDKLGGYAGASYRFLDESHSASDLKRTDHLLQERVGLGAAGSVYSPNFLLYEATGVVGPMQEWAEDQSASTYDSGELYEVDAGMHLFPKRFHPADLSFSREETIQPQIFTSQLELTTTTGTATQHFLNDDGGLHLSYLHREIEQRVFGGEELPLVDVVEDTAGASGDYRLTARQNVSASYNFQHVDQLEAEENSFDAHNVLANHEWYFGGERDHDLRTRFEANLQQGSLDQKLFRWHEIFESKITKDLSGDTQFRFEKNDTNLIDLTTIRGEGSLRHQLYDSLSTTLHLFGGRQIVDGSSTTDNVGGDLSFLYHKKTPAGIFRCTSVTFLERRFTENDQGGAIDESHTFPAAPPEEIRLLRSGIDLASLVITDPTGLIFYRENTDYTLAQDSNGFITITRVFTGTIPLGGTILVDYVFKTGTDFTLDTFDQTLRLEHEFTGGLTPYFALFYQDQNFEDVEGPGNLQPIDERSLIGGLEWRRPSFLMGGEYENRESTILPFDAVRLRAQGTYQIDNDHRVLANILQSWLFYQDPGRDVSILQGNARWQSTLERHLTFSMDSFVFYEYDTLQGTSYGFAFVGALDYVWRQFHFRLEAAHRENYGVTDHFRFDEVAIRMVRDFGSSPPTTTAAMNRFLRQ